MSKKRRLIIVICIVLAFLAVAGWYLARTNIPVLEPAGPIGMKERNLIIFALLLSLVVVIPVFSMAIGFAWKYREGNTKARYRPDFDHSRIAETAWWLIPGVLILILSVVTWNSSHSLDPYRPIASTTRPLPVEVVALDWKWLFIYPEQNVASVNALEVPINTPVAFQITSDAPMNSFWIPQLGGQIYAMPGMSTQLHLEASKTGNFYGSSANISGAGFAAMNFMTHAVSSSNFAQWLRDDRSAHTTLNLAAYDQLAKPSQNNSVRVYSSVDPGLYSAILAKYMAPQSTDSGQGSSTYQSSGMQGMGM